MSDRNAEPLANPLSPLWPLAGRDPIWDRCRVLGAMALVDLHFWGAVHTTPIADYSRERSEAVGAGRAGLLLDAHSRPSAYRIDDVSRPSPFREAVATRYQPAQARRPALDVYATFGLILELLASSACHRRFHLGYCFRIVVLQPVRRRQLQLLTREGRPFSFVSWPTSRQAAARWRATSGAAATGCSSAPGLRRSATPAT